MNCSNIIPAIPGTTIIHYNKAHDSTQEELVLFWGVSHDEEDNYPSVVPFTLLHAVAQAIPFDFPDCIEIIAIYIPGVGRISAFDNSPVYGNYIRQVKGYHPDFGINNANPTTRN